MKEVGQRRVFAAATAPIRALAENEAVKNPIIQTKRNR
jgi:hypothetical protein